MGAPPPFELILAQIIETWHIAPSVLMAEDADQILKYWRIAREYDHYYKKRPKGLRGI